MVHLGAARVERWSDRILDAAVVLLATWTVACVNADDQGRHQALRGFGFTPPARSAAYRCLQRG